MIDDYKSADATGLECNECLYEPSVTFFPTPGSQIAVPSYVVLTADNPDAVIRYTTDGTTPDTLSPQYTGPISIDSPFTQIQAIAHVEECESVNVNATSYAHPPFPFVFSYACDTPDKGGSWNVWAPDGGNDHHWTLQFTLAGATTIKRLEVFQLDADGNWTGGQAWSTGNPIHPFEDTEDEFEVFPLLVFIAAVQQWAAYQSSLGSFGIGTHTWELYGDIVLAASGLFRLDIVLSDDTRLTQIINTTCSGVAPPLCPPPATPTAVGKCDGVVDITFSGTVGRPYKIFASSVDCESGTWSQVLADVIAISPQTVEITGLEAGCVYRFYVSIDEAGCGYRDSATATAAPTVSPSVSIAIDKTVVDPGESFELTWSSTNIGGATCGGCADGEVSLNQGLGCRAGNASEGQSHSQATCGLYTYTITGCNACGTVVASVQIEVRCTALCSGIQPDILQVQSAGVLFGDDCADLSGCTPYECEVCYHPKWDGRIYKTADREAPHYICSAGTALTTCGGEQVKFGCVYTDCSEDVPCMYPFKNATVDFNAEELRWELKLFSCDELVWFGIKLLGDDATGVYAYNGGCASGPATVTLVEGTAPSP